MSSVDTKRRQRPAKATATTTTRRLLPSHSDTRMDSDPSMSSSSSTAITSRRISMNNNNNNNNNNNAIIKSSHYSSPPLCKMTVLLALIFSAFTTTSTVVSASAAGGGSSHIHHEQQRPQLSSRFTFRLPGRPMEGHDDDDYDDEGRVVGRGREFDLFDNRNTSPRAAAAARVHDEDSTRSILTDDEKDDESLIRPASSSSSTSSSSSSFRNRPSGRRISDAASYPDNTGHRADRRPDNTHQNENDDATTLVSDKNNNNNNNSNNESPSSTTSRLYPPLPSTPSLTGGSSSTSNRGGFPRITSDYGPSPMQRQRSESSSNRSIFQPVSNWWTTNISPNIKNWPKIRCRLEPTTTLKLRKTFRPLKTIVRLGADFNTQLGVWQFKSSWEDAIIGGKITLVGGKELQLAKSWQLSVGNNDDLITRLRFRAAVDLQTWKAYARVGFRTERLSPINVMEGFTVFQQVPLDGSRGGHVKLQVKANFALPEPEIEYSTENKQRSFVGAMGDIEINIDEVNLLLDY